jgi:hypothetical protein
MAYDNYPSVEPLKDSKITYMMWVITLGLIVMKL